MPKSLVVVMLLSTALMCAAAAATAQENKPNILVLATGGTIAQTTSKDATLLGDALINAVPKMKDVANVSAEQIVQVSSPDITVENWVKLAKRINEALANNDVKGVVVTHGTDTMEETAYFLDLVVKSEKPVVLVGSMRGSQALSADGPANLFNAVAIASSEEAKGKGVLITLNDQIQSARDVTKTNTFTLDTFRSLDFGALGYVQAGKPYFYRTPIRKHTTQSQFDLSVDSLPQVAILYSYVGVKPNMIDAVIASGVKGIVWAGTGNGSVPKAIQPAAQEAVKKGIIFVRSSRVNGGIVERNGEHNDDELGFVTSDSLNPQKARVLLMLALTKSSDFKAIQDVFNTY
ncbi:asparaginase [Mesorhizobium sp. M0833]|uniref:asparaginase n=1 Tax=Mesorhizobium sp. M0833 TaxID=2957009 RepID=UPI00333D3C67